MASIAPSASSSKSTTRWPKPPTRASPTKHASIPRPRTRAAAIRRATILRGYEPNSLLWRNDMVTVKASALGGKTIAAQGKKLSVANLTGAVRVAEKSIELTTCAQLGALLGKRMVWFGLTQAQERKYGYDAATNLGGRAFILQFKASTTVMKTTLYAGQRRFQCQHFQMVELVKRFGSVPNSCFYFLPNMGAFSSELLAVKGDLINNSYLVDVARIPKPVPTTSRKSGYHHVFLNKTKPSVTITSTPVEVEHVLRCSVLRRIALSDSRDAFPDLSDDP